MDSKENISSLPVQILLDDTILQGDLRIPENSDRIVIFAHGSGSSRLSPRNQYVAEALNRSGLATLLFDLLTNEEEEIDRETLEFRFDIPMLAQRLVATTDWFSIQPEFNKFKIGFFGASTGAAAALIAAAERPDLIQVVVSRGGRPDLAEETLPRVQAATLLIVGELDYTVIELNRKAKQLMKSLCKIEIVPGATHLFEEPGTLDIVVSLAQQWFEEHL